MKKLILLSLLGIAELFPITLLAQDSTSKPKPNYTQSQPQSAMMTDSRMFQVATLYSLEAGVFEGDYPYKKLMSQGNFGIGTFNTIDGELVALDGQFYQSTPDCHLQKVSPELIAPFAEIMNFKPTIRFDITGSQNFNELGHQLIQHFPNDNKPYAVRINGTFSAITIRSLRKQKAPYPNLLEATKSQGTLQLKNVKGTLVGFWFPHYWEGIGLPGFHFHFATDDRQFGGHVLDMTLAQGNVQMQPITNVEVNLPDNLTFAKVKLDSKKVEEDTLKAEGEKNPAK